eukprot:8566469-Ditylum_brightwellii.AAC.1
MDQQQYRQHYKNAVNASWYHWINISTTTMDGMKDGRGCINMITWSDRDVIGKGYLLVRRGWEIHSAEVNIGVW